MRVFLTGVAGFAGSHLAEALTADGGFAVGGLLAPGESPRHLSAVAERVRLFSADLLDQDALARSLREFAPEAVVHLAAVAFVLSDPEKLRRVNVDGSRALLGAMRAACPGAKGIFISSSEVYDVQRPGEPSIGEDHRIAPSNPYAKSKLAMEEIVAEFRSRDGMDLAVLRPFNHIGPRQSSDFVISSFTRQIARIEAGKQEPVLRVGNLTPRRDFTDVRDVARAYLLAVRRARSGDVFNVATGRSHAIQEAIDILLALSSAKIDVLQDPERMRPSEKPDVIGSAQRFRNLTGWTPIVPFDRSLRDALDYWRQTA